MKVEQATIEAVYVVSEKVKVPEGVTDLVKTDSFVVLGIVSKDGGGGAVCTAHGTKCDHVRALSQTE